MTSRTKASSVALVVIVAAFGGGAAMATEPVLRIRPDSRAVESGLYIQPVKLAKRAEFPFAVIEPSGVDRRRGPVRGSLPFYRGELKDPKNIRLSDDAGRKVPVQGFATAFWPEGTVKFLCIDFLTDLKAGRTKKFRLEYGTAVKPNVKTALRVNRAGGGVAVDTGLMKVTFAPGREFCSGIIVGGRATTRGPVRGRLLVSEGEPLNGPREYPLVVEKVELVENGPVQATVYLKGSYGTLRSATPLTWQKRRNVPRYVFYGFVRLYADSGRMDVIHSFGYNGDEKRDFVRRYGLVVPLATKNARFVYGGDKGIRREVPLNGDLQLVQPGHSSWRLTGASQASGGRFGGWAAVKGDGVAAVAGLRDAWQQWPVSFYANEKGDLGLDIYGGAEDTFLDLRFVGEGFDKRTGKGFHKSKSTYTGEKFSTHYTGGRGPTHRAMGLLKVSELVLDFTPGADPASVGNGHHKMLVPWPGVERFSNTRVFGLTGYYTEGPKMRRARDYFSIILDYPYVAHNVNGLFGWVDWPDAPDFGRPKDGRFDTSIFGGGVGWTNGERQVMGYFGHYVASGWRRALDLGHQSALHSIGIDIEHPGGDQKTGTPHRHNQVHWADGGGPRQAGWRGWYMDYWLTGHNEMWRSLKELHYVRYGVHPNSTRAKWPWHKDTDPRELVAAEDQKNVWVSSSDGTPFHWMNFMRWQTTGESHFVRHLDLLMEAWRRNPYLEKGGKRLTVDGFTADLEAGKIAGFSAGVRFPPTDQDDPPEPYYPTYYWGTYGGASLVSEWAQLTGSGRAVETIVAFGDYYASDKRGAHRVDIKNSNKRTTGSWQQYRSYEGIVPAYSLLRRNTHPERVDRWVRAMKWRMFDYVYGSPKQMARGAEPLPLDEYTADKWAGLGVRCDGQNGHKIKAAVAMTSIYTLWLTLPEKSKIRRVTVPTAEVPSGRPPSIGRPAVARKVRGGDVPGLAEARALASRGDYEAAAQKVEREIPAAARGADELRALAAGFRASKEMRAWIIEGASAGRQESVFIALMGIRMRGKVVAADEDGLTVSVLGRESRMGWSELSPSRFLSLAKKYAREGAEIEAEKADVLRLFSRACGLDSGP